MANPLKLLMKEALKSKGVYGAKRVERAADEIKNLDKMYSEEALRQAFLANPSGELRSGLMTMRPADFERYAAPLNRPFSRDTVENVEKLTKLKKGFDDVPFLELEPASYKGANVGVSGHEGRHRSVALDRRGEQSSLVRAFPDRMLIDRKRGMTDEELIDQMRQKLGEQRLVVPQTHRNIERDVVELPDVYKGGGAVRKADGGAATYNEAMLRRTGKFSQSDLDKMRRELEENARRIAAEKQAMLDNPPPAEMTEYNPTLQQRLGSAAEKGLKAIGATTPRARELSDILTGGRMGSPLPLGMSVMDFTPAAIPVYGGQGVMNAAEAAGKGNYGEAALELGLAGIDLAAAYPATKALAKSAKPMVKAGAKAMAPKVDDLAMQYMMKTGMALPMDVWHGSPHRFPSTKKNPLGEFDPTKIGTGEGNQAYGYGHYVAERPGVAETYRHAGKMFIPADGSLPMNVVFKGKGPANQSALDAYGTLRHYDQDPKKVAEMLRMDPKFSDEAKWLEKNANDISIENASFLYKVDLPDEQIEKMLDWDKPLSEQPKSLNPLLAEIENVGSFAAEKIRTLANQPNVADWAKRDLLKDAEQVENSKSPAHVAGVLKRMQLEYGISTDSGPFQTVAPDFLSFVRGMQAVPNMDTGGGAVSYLQARYGEKGASEMLREAGIPGIKYLDQASRDVGEGTRNFVVFPGGEEMLTIKERMKEGGKVKKPLSMDAMRLAVGGMAGGGVRKAVTRTIEEARRLHEAAQKTRSKAAQIEAGLYHPIGGGVKLSKPTELMTASVVDDPSVKPVPRKIMTLEDLQGGVAIPLVGDRAAAGRILEEVEGKRLRTPVKLQGGPGFMQTHTFEGQPEKSAAWASGKGVVTALGNQARRAAELAGTDKVIAPYVAMSPEGVDYNTMLSRAILGQLDIGSLSKRAIQSFNKEVRKVEPRFVGIESPQLEAQLFGGAKEAGNVRKAFVNRMGLEEFRQRGFPDVAATRKAITEPELLHRDLGATGYNIARLDPEGRIVDDPLIPHETYPVQLRGEYMGSLEEEVPYREFFHGFTDKRRAFGTPEGSDWRAFSMSAPIQQLDQEWLDRVMKSMGKDKPREWKKGGTVKKAVGGGVMSAGQKLAKAFVEAGKKAKLPEQAKEAASKGDLFLPDEEVRRMQRELLQGVKKPEELAEGGQITADDLVIEERKL